MTGDLFQKVLVVPDKGVAGLSTGRVYWFRSILGCGISRSLIPILQMPVSSWLYSKTEWNQ